MGGGKGVIQQPMKGQYWICELIYLRSWRLHDGVNMDLRILCKSCLMSIQSILLYVDPKKSSFFFHLERERGNKEKQLLELFIYIFVFPDFDSFQMLPFLLFCQINKKEHLTSDSWLCAFLLTFTLKWSYFYLLMISTALCMPARVIVSIAPGHLRQYAHETTPIWLNEFEANWNDMTTHDILWSTQRTRDDL